MSFQLSQHAINVQLARAEAYYLHDDGTALNKSVIARITDWVNLTSGVLFVVGISLMTAFVIVNFERGLKMSNEKTGQRVPMREGASIPKMQEVTLQKGAPIPNFQQLPQSQPQQNQPPAQSIPAISPANSNPAGGGKK